MTKKELEKIVSNIVSAVVLRNTEGLGDTYEITPSDEDQARTLVGMTLKANKDKLVAAVPVIGGVS